MQIKVPFLDLSAAHQPIREQLDAAIREVTRRPEFVWREPRVAKPGSSNAFLAFTEDAIRVVRTWVQRVAGWIGEIVRAVIKWLFGNNAADEPGGSGRRGPITEKIQQKFFSAVYGRDPAYRSWLHRVPVGIARAGVAELG